MSHQREYINVAFFLFSLHFSLYAGSSQVGVIIDIFLQVLTPDMILQPLGSVTQRWFLTVAHVSTWMDGYLNKPRQKREQFGYPLDMMNLQSNTPCRTEGVMVEIFNGKYLQMVGTAYLQAGHSLCVIVPLLDISSKGRTRLPLWNSGESHQFYQVDIWWMSNRIIIIQV